MSYRLKTVVTAYVIGFLGIGVYKNRKEIMEIATQVYELLRTGGEYLIPRIDLDHAEDAPEVETKGQNDSENQHEAISENQHETKSENQHETESEIQHKTEIEIQQEPKSKNQHETEIEIQHETESEIQHAVTEINEVTKMNTDKNNQSTDVIKASSRAEKPISNFGLKLDFESIRSLFLEREVTFISGNTRNLSVQVVHINEHLNQEMEDAMITRPSTSASRTDTEVIQKVVRSLEDLLESQGPTGFTTTYAILDTKDMNRNNSVEYEISVKFGNVRESFRNYNSGFVIYKYCSGVNVPEESLVVKTGGTNELCLENLSVSCVEDFSNDISIESSSKDLHTVYRKSRSHYSLIEKGELDSELLRTVEPTREVVDHVETLGQMKHLPTEMNLHMVNKNRVVIHPLDLYDIVDADGNDFIESTQEETKSKFDVTEMDNTESIIEQEATAAEKLGRVIELEYFAASEVEVEKPSQYENVLAQSLTTNDFQLTDDPADNTELAEYQFIGIEYHEATTSRDKIRTLAELFEAKQPTNTTRSIISLD